VLAKPRATCHISSMSGKPAGQTVRAQLDALLRDGYVILEGLIDRDQCQTIRDEATRLLDRTGANPFEGHKTQRVYAPLSKTRAIDDLIDHPRR
jgi:hypothetical protein